MDSGLIKLAPPEAWPKLWLPGGEEASGPLPDVFYLPIKFTSEPDRRESQRLLKRVLLPQDTEETA